MKIFKDSAGDEYQINLSVKLFQEIEALLGINLGLPDIGSPPLWTRLTSDAVLVSKLIWLSCRACESVKIHAIREDHFYEDILVGAIFEEAHKLWLHEYRDFFQQRSIGGTGQRLSKALDVFLNLLNSGVTSTRSPGQSGSTPAVTPSVNSAG